MDAAITVTTECGAKCKTCPSWQRFTREMQPEVFKYIYTKLNADNITRRILINNTGDIYFHSHCMELFNIIESLKKKPVIITTNAAYMDYIPNVDEFIISFNGGDKKSYEYTTGLPFEKVLKNIYKNYEIFKDIKAEIHCLIWEGNRGCENRFKKLFKDFPGRLRISYKYDNQFQKDYTLDKYKKNKRIVCQYIRELSINIDGTINSCAHDFEGATNWGNIMQNEVHELVSNNKRRKKYQEHKHGIFKGLCKNCNFNTPVDERVYYVS